MAQRRRSVELKDPESGGTAEEGEAVGGRELSTEEREFLERERESRGDRRGEGVRGE